MAIIFFKEAFEMKRIASMLMAVLLCAAFVLCASAETSKYGGVADQTVYAYGKDIVIGETGELCDGYTYVVIEGRGEIEEAVPLSVTDKTKTKMFVNNIYDKNGTFICTLQVTVSGMYSPQDRVSEISSVKYLCTGTHSDYVTISKKVSGNTAELRLYYLGKYIGKFTYTISYSGNIQQS